MTTGLHERSQDISAQAALAEEAGKTDVAHALYLEAANWEMEAIRSTPLERRRTRSILAVSAVAQLYKAQAWQEAEEMAATFLKDESLSGFARAELGDTVRSIRIARGATSAKLRKPGSIPLEASPLMTLVDAGNVAQRGLEQRLSHLRLSVVQERILALVYFAREPLTPSMLAALLLQETHSVSGLLNRLEDRGLIIRTRDRQDRRVVWVGLTATGKKVAEEAIQISVDMANEYKKVFKAPGVDKLNDMIRDVRDLGFRIAGVREDIRREALKRL